jgi:hypothetical protein
MRRIPNEWNKLEYLDPEAVLLGLRELQYSGVLEALPYKVAALRTHELRLYQEGRQAALFCYGMSHRVGKKVLFSMVEKQDYDFVAFYQDDDVQRFAPVQLKELVPPETVPNGPLPELQKEIDKLKKYTDSEDLVVAIHINRNITINPAELRPPQANLGALWLFGATDSSQQTWMIMGNLLKSDPVVFNFRHPTVV